MDDWFGLYCYSFYLSTDSFFFFLVCFYFFRHVFTSAISQSLNHLILILYHNYYFCPSNFLFMIIIFPMRDITSTYSFIINSTAEHQLCKTESGQYFVELVNRKEIQRVVGFNNDDVWMMMQLLIPSRGSLYSDSQLAII